ncbi:MAG: sodium-translocating pyrophosphatase [DPANN group archaeon]|nr:sodium-translocating pyrophosphatase [DPANN group archaeon]
MTVDIVVMVVSVLALLYAVVLAMRVKAQKVGSAKTKEIMEAIHEGAMAFLNKEYRILVVFVLAVFLILGFSLTWNLAIAFIIGAVFSALAGNIGMRIATMANARTAHACETSLNAGLKVAFSSGSVMGMTVTGLGLFGVTLLYYIFGDPRIIYGFGFGASSIALFARVGGGIFTKAADVGADLVGKIEAGIPEDDPRNPATIADNVGDNVGDVAGMGADLFESYVDSLIVTMVMGTSLFAASRGVWLPLWIAAAGLFSSIIGSFFVNAKEGSSPHKALNRGIWVASVLMAVLSYFIIDWLVGTINLFWAALAGLAAGLVIGKATEYYTSDDRKPTQEVARASQTGAATNIISGLALGMHSTMIPVLAVVTAIFLSFWLGGLYGIALAAVGMLSTLGITLATDTYGPVADNAAGIAEMAGLGKEVRKRAEALDAVGNTTAAIGKGFAIGSAALTALALFVGYTQAVGLKVIDIINPMVIIGLFIGGLLPFLFSAMTMKAVGSTAEEMVEEVRRQFREIKGIMTGKAKPDYGRCVSISTHAALKKMVVPSLMAIIVPLLVGLLLGAEALGGMLGGSIVTGFLLAVMMANSGGAWDNAKKYIESGHLGGKGSAPHKAAVVGDTVGDPFKDTSGPSLNILIKLMSIVALVFAPLIAHYGGWLL